MDLAKFKNFLASKVCQLSDEPNYLKYKERFFREIKNLEEINELEYFYDLYKKKLKYSQNENNLLIPYLLGVVPDFNIDKDFEYDYGEFPDIDVDYSDHVREYLKNDFSKKQYGADKVCNIGTYGTFGVKSSLKDIAKVFGVDFAEVNAATKGVKDKDSDGKAYTWDQICELYTQFDDFCKKYPHVMEAAKKLVGRIRGQGQHASGLVVSNVPVADYIPLIRGKEGHLATAWPEGLGSTDLSTVGFIKFDFLGLDGNIKINDAVEIACRLDYKAKKANQDILDCLESQKVCFLEGQPNWSDTRYLNDPECIKVANRGDLRMIFQFDGSPGIRQLVKKGGVTNFKDLVAYTSLFRPGPMKLDAHNDYCLRKRGQQKYIVPEILKEGPANLSDTYGILCYQEQIARNLRDIGKLPEKDCDTIRKSISKKKIEKFLKYKQQYLETGKKILGCSDEEIEREWKLIEAFAGYGFNMGHATGYTIISSRMLWLKVHKPLAFFSSMLKNTKAKKTTDYDKIKEYKSEAKKFGVKINRFDVNKSGLYFEVQEGEIYYGLSKIKGLGIDGGKEVIKHRPYNSFREFIQKCSTLSKICLPIIGLRCFEGDPVQNYKDWEVYRKNYKKLLSSQKTYEKTKQKLEAKIEEYKELEWECEKYKLKLEKHKQTWQEKINNIDLFKDDEKTKFSEKIIKIIKDKEESEKQYYGYLWQHPIQELDSYDGSTLGHFFDSDDETDKVHVQVKTVEEKKGPKAKYWDILLEDSNFQTVILRCFGDDYERFSEEFQPNNFISVEIGKPSIYRSVNLVQKAGGRWSKLKKCDDFRVKLL